MGKISVRNIVATVPGSDSDRTRIEAVIGLGSDLDRTAPPRRIAESDAAVAVAVPDAFRVAA